MKYDRLYNFISPVTGKLPIDRGYTLLGDKDGKSFASPVFIDVRQDIIDLKRQIGNFEELKKLDHNRIWIGDYYNEPQESLHIGVINLPPLAEALFPNPISPIIGDFRIPNPTFDYLSPFDWVMSGPYLPQIYATKYDTFGNPIGTDISSSLAMTQVRAAQIMKRFDNANFIVGSSTVTFDWENPKMYLIPEAIKQLYGLGTTYTFTKAQSLGNLETGLLKNIVNNRIGTLSTAIAGKDYVEIAAPIANMQIALIRPLQEDEAGKDIAKLISRIDRLPEENMPDLTFIMQRPNSKIPNAQGLSDIAGLLGGILKCNNLGVISLASGGKLPIINDYVRPIDLEEEISERVAGDTALETTIGTLQADLESQLAAITGYGNLALLVEFLGNLGWSTGYTEYQLSQLRLVIDNDGNTISHMEGDGFLNRKMTTGTHVPVKLKSVINLLNNDQRFSFDSKTQSSQFVINTYTRNNDVVNPLKLAFLTSDRHLDLLQPSGDYMIEKGFIFDNEFGYNNDINAPNKISLKLLKYKDNKVYNSNPTQIETIFEYNREKETFDFQKNVRFLGTGAAKIPVGTIAERPSNSELGMLRYNIEL